DKLVTGVQTCALPISRPNPNGEVGMSWTRLITLVVALLGALVFAGVASASITISGTGKGIERPQGDGLYALEGTWTDSASGTNRSEERRVGKECEVRW